MIDLKRISPLWFLFVLMLFPLSFSAAARINAALGGIAPGMTGWQQAVRQPATLIVTLVAGLMFLAVGGVIVVTWKQSRKVGERMCL